MTQVSSASEGAESFCKCRGDGFCRFGALGWTASQQVRVQGSKVIGPSYVIKLLGIVV